MFGGVEHESLNPQRLQRTSDVSEKDNLYARPMLKRKKKSLCAENCAVSQDLVSTKNSIEQCWGYWNVCASGINIYVGH